MPVLTPTQKLQQEIERTKLLLDFHKSRNNSEKVRELTLKKQQLQKQLETT
jgi:hypothetical protein